MKHIILTLLMIFAPMPLVAGAVAVEPAYYCAKISSGDQITSKGQKLQDAGAILQQDRANYHRFNLRDFGDQLDPIFADPAVRAQIPRLLAASQTPGSVLREIEKGTPDICVDVSGKAMTVTLAAPAAERPVAGADSYPFEGRWSCEVAEFTFTSSTYNNGSENLPIREIQEGSDGSYTLMFDDDYMITLSGFTGSAMGWFSHSSQDNFLCQKL
ncbi:hypothetical protein SAMN04488523_108109 [Sulfitobacter brevis]|uniref:YARHG domain-containing protein n=1 Tax=Sulfitobacter brevis TaxID=74348 RepID=A0A1I2BK98_9RHOB|nr:hypothetical protein [Sulfitobacter brevis]SFE55693.1 hypothetical protein SAMN04488523_108109 [Sulfitobacter brevis]